MDNKPSLFAGLSVNEEQEARDWTCAQSHTPNEQEEADEQTRQVSQQSLDPVNEQDSSDDDDDAFEITTVPSVEDDAVASNEVENNNNDSAVGEEKESTDDSAAAVVPESQSETTEQASDVDVKAPEPAASSYGGIFGWFSSAPAAETKAQPVEETADATDTTEKDLVAPEADEATTDVSETGTTSEDAVEVEADNTENAPSQGEDSPNVADEEAEEEDTMPARKEMDVRDEQALDDAFAHESNNSAHVTPHADITDLPPPPPPPATPNVAVLASPEVKRPRGLGLVHADTPIPHGDVALRLLRKFAAKTRPKIVTTYGGTKSRGIFNYLFGTKKEDQTFVPYRELMNILYNDGEDDDEDFSESEMMTSSDADDPDKVVESVLGSSRDTMARARLAVAAFVWVFSQWGHASSRMFEQKDVKSQKAFSELMVVIFDSASQLVAHGCLDDVWIGMGPAKSCEYHPAVHMLAQSVFNADLTLDANELSAMKFLLGTGCRVTPAGGALLRGGHLLQTIRSLYHIFLTTDAMSNKTTARAALQQLVMSVFGRVVRETQFKATSDLFPSDNHRDAFLVLRSLCKLSMRSLTDPSVAHQSHVGYQASGSSEMWAGVNDNDKDGDATAIDKKFTERTFDEGDSGEAREHAQLLYTAAVHPALESKILALELLLYVLQNTTFDEGFIQRSGPQFHAAVRNYLCVSLLKNCTSNNTRVVNLSLLIFVPLVRNFRSILKNEIEAFVTNVFFVILESKNSPIEHKQIVVNTFDEICSDPATLAEIFLNYDCDLSAVDLFNRIVNTLSKMSRAGIQEPKSSGMSFMGGPSATYLEKLRNENRELRLEAMKALRRVLASLHASIIEPMHKDSVNEDIPVDLPDLTSVESKSNDGGRQSLVDIYGSKKKRRAEESEAVLRFNQKPSAGIAYAAQCQHIDATNPGDVAGYLLKNKDVFEKTQIGELLGREPEYQNGFSLKVLHEYVRMLDFKGLDFDDAIRYFLSGFRLPGEAQKIDRIMEKFAERYTEQNPEVFPTADVAFILAFSIIMLNTDLHNPAIKEDRRMTKEGFIRNNRGICDGQDLPEELLTAIFDRIRLNPISLKEDDDARERAGDSKGANTGLPAALSPASFFTNHYVAMDRARETNFQKERDHIVRTTETLLKRRRHSSVDNSNKTPSQATKVKKTPKSASRFVRTEDSGLRDEYVSPMFEVTWGPALAAFSTAMESANGTIGALISIASDEELERAAENAAETIEVCLTGFRFAICTAGLCGNDTARDAYMLALSRFSQLGTGALLEHRHVRCIQTMLSLAREDAELIGSSWEHIFRALSEINRFHQLFQLMARNDRAAAAAAARRRKKQEEKEQRRERREIKASAAMDAGDSLHTSTDDGFESEVDSLAESELFSDSEDYPFEEDMDAKAIDEANARTVYEAASENMIEAIYERSSTLSASAVTDFVSQLCHVSGQEISAGNRFNQNGSSSADNTKSDLTHVSYRQQHALLNNKSNVGPKDFHHSQPNIYNLQKLVEVTHYNMDSRPRLIFADLWAIVAEHLTATALHPNPALAMYAVDSFRQLSIQYLQRDELEVFEFQKRFLKPMETVMSKSDQRTTKELLLDCVGRIIEVFGDGQENKSSTSKGGLKSGWMPLLKILGLGGIDANIDVARLSFRILSDEIKQCLTASDSDNKAVLLSEHFIETVDALFMFINGPHEEISAEGLSYLNTLASFLSRTSTLPNLRRRTASSAIQGQSSSKQELELWWPILLGVSEVVGDPRYEVRSQALQTLVSIIEMYFLEDTVGESGDTNDKLQTLQLVFRGILTPVLECAETGSEDTQTPSLPSDFERFISSSGPNTVGNEEAVEEEEFSGWLETTYDHFMDACISLCIKSMKIHNDDVLVEEIFAILNNCLLSDSGALAVRGLRRMEQFITSDLDISYLSDDVWATVCHMLRRCLSVRSMPFDPQLAANRALPNGVAKDDEAAAEFEEGIREFVIEDSVLLDRRYVGSNAAMVVGSLLTSERYSASIGLRWRLFLIAGLGRAIAEWEQAALILSQNTPPKTEGFGIKPPEYIETAVYGRKWMNRFLLNLAANTDIVKAEVDDSVSASKDSNKYAAGQKLVADETKRLLVAYLEREHAASQYEPKKGDVVLHRRFTALVLELLTGYNNMDVDHLKDMTWISPILLSSCIQSKNEEIRLAVQKLVQRTSPVTEPVLTTTNSKTEEEPKNEDTTGQTDDMEPQQSAPADETQIESNAENNDTDDDDEAFVITDEPSDSAEDDKDDGNDKVGEV